MARKRKTQTPIHGGKQVRGSAIKLGREIVRNSAFIEGQTAPAFSRQIDTQLTYAEANLGSFLQLPKATNHIAQDMLTDLFWNMFKSRHAQKPNVPKGREFSRHLLNHLTNMPTFKAGKKGTLGRKASAVAAARALLKELLEDEEMREMMEQLSQMGGGEPPETENEEDSDDEGNSSGNSKGKGKGKGKPQKQNPQDDQQDEDDEDNNNDDSGSDEYDDEEDGEDENPQNDNDDNDDNDVDSDGEDQQSGDFEQQQQLLDKLKNKLDTINGSIGATAAVAEGFDEGGEVGKLIASLGMNENNMTPEDIEKVLNVVQSEEFSKLSNLIGRSYGTAKDVLRGRSMLPIIIDEAGKTRDIDDIFDDELALMSPNIDVQVRREQIGRYVRSGLSGMTRTSQNQHGGTKIFALDESGSTSADFRDAKTNQSTGIPVSAVERGFGLGLCRAAKSQGQAWYMFGWSSPDEYTETISHKDGIGKLMDFIAYNIDGGQTSFDTALGRSLEIISSLPEDERYQTDIVIITDGQGALYESIIQKYKTFKAEYGTRLYVVTIGTHSNESLEEIADYCLPFTSMADATGKMAELMWIERDRNVAKK